MLVLGDVDLLTLCIVWCVHRSVSLTLPLPLALILLLSEKDIVRWCLTGSVERENQTGNMVTRFTWKNGS